MYTVTLKGTYDIHYPKIWIFVYALWRNLVRNEETPFAFYNLLELVGEGFMEELILWTCALECDTE